MSTSFIISGRVSTTIPLTSFLSPPALAHRERSPPDVYTRCMTYSYTRSQHLVKLPKDLFCSVSLLMKSVREIRRIKALSSTHSDRGFL